MRIAVYWEQSDWGGVDTHLLTLLSNWPSPDDHFVVFYNKGNLGLERIRPSLEKLPNVELREIASFSYNIIFPRISRGLGFRWLRPFVYFLQPAFFFLMIFWISCVLRKEGGFDVLLANDGCYPGAWGSLSALIASKRVGVRTRFLLVHHAACRPGLFMGWFEWIVDRMVTRTASAIVCVSDATRRTLLERRAINDELVRMRVIHNGVSHCEKNTDTACPDIRALVDAGSAKLIGIVGRIQPYKGHEDIIMAFARLGEKLRKQLKLAVIGVGETSEVSRLERLASRLGVTDQVHFLGYLPGAPTDLIVQLDLLVVATKSFEGFGLTLAEAMQVETPVLATRVGAIPEFLNTSVGMIVSPNSPVELAVAFEDFLSHPDIWRERAKQARIHIQQVGGGMADEYHRMFRECAEE